MRVKVMPPPPGDTPCLDLPSGVPIHLATRLCYICRMKNEADRVRQALELFHENDFTRAEIVLESVDFDALEDDLHVEALYLWGLLLRQKGDPLEAARRFQMCVKLNPEFFPALDAWGNVLASIGDARSAIEKYKRALSVADDAQSAHILYNYGQVLLRNGYYLRALRKFRDAFQRAPDSDDAAYMAGLSFIRLGRPRGARKWMSAALRLNPRLARNHVGAGNAELADGRHEAAESHYARALELDPDCADAHYNWAVSLAMQGDYAAAIRHCKQGLRANPDGFELLAQHTWCLRRMGAYDAALQSARRMRQVIDRAENAERKPEFLDLLAANEAGCMHAVHRNQRARQTLLSHLRASLSPSPHSLAELRRQDSRTLQNARKYELTIRVRREGSPYGDEPARPVRYLRTYWVISDSLTDARRIVRELEPQDAELRFEPDVKTLKRYSQAERGTVERSPAIAAD